MTTMDHIEKASAILKPHWPVLMKHFERESALLSELLSVPHDPIGRVLKCHLIVEHYLNRFLKKHFQLSDLDDARLTFAQKARLLPSSGSSAGWVKPGILQLNVLRNRFGHSLSTTIVIADLGPMLEVLEVARDEPFEAPLEAIEVFTTIACTFLLVSPPELERIFSAAFSALKPKVGPS